MNEMKLKNETTGMTQEIQTAGNTEMVPMESGEKRSGEAAGKTNQISQSQSPNPSGRARKEMTEEQRDALEEIRALAPTAVDKLKGLLKRNDLSPTLQIRLCELIFERTYGKPETSMKLTSVTRTVEQSRGYVLALVDTVRQARLDAGEEA